MLLYEVGRVPEGAFNSEQFEFDSVQDALDDCDSANNCAGITYHPFEQNPDEWAVIFHSFIPPLLNNTEEHDWITQRSDKSFIFHSGKVVSNEILAFDVDLSTFSLSEAGNLCKNDPDCVAFSYPVNATKLNGFAEIIFVGSVESIMDTPGNNWRTVALNDESKAGRMVNGDALEYDEDLESMPYNTCCKRVSSLEDAHLPSIEEVQEMDTLSRIPCSISKEEFQANYEFTRRPVVLEGCDATWPAKTKWTIEKLTERFGDDNITTWRTKTIDRPGEWDEELSWNDVMAMRGKNNGVYIFDPVESTGKESIHDDYEVPGPMKGTDYFPDDFPPNWGK